mgnify:CR=1 FL=1
MDVKIIKIESKGDFDKEYVLLEVLSDCEIGEYLLADSSYTSEGKLSNKIRHIYWFPNKTVKKGDFVFVFTRPKKMNDKTEWSNNYTNNHAFYWNLKIAIWNDEGDYATLFEIKSRIHKKVSNVA